MGPGFNRMNDLVIIQTSQGLARYLNESEVKNRKKGVVIGYDGRYHSKTFAEYASIAFISVGIPVYLCSQIVPTPFIPFAIKRLGLLSGIMITASHNPKDDNGYKVYGQNGAQIISPHDRYIQDHILINLEPWANAWNKSLLKKAEDKLSVIENEYYKTLRNQLFDVKSIESARIAITHSSMHGVAHIYAQRLFKFCGFTNIHFVPQQAEPDPEFSTVQFPNPEEEGAMDYALETAVQTESVLVFANDPDADRLAVAERQKDNSYRIFTGNELGMLLGHWMWFVHNSTETSYQKSDCYMLSSAVSTKFLATMAKVEGFNHIETLTGFKWMGNEGHVLLNRDKKVLFAFEEAIGYMCGTHILDKDGLTAMIHVAQMASYLKVKKDITLCDQLYLLFDKYGYHYSINSYFTCGDVEVIDSVFVNLTNMEGRNRYVSKMGGHKVIAIRDLRRCFDSSRSDFKPVRMCSCNFVINVTINLIFLTIRFCPAVHRPT